MAGARRVSRGARGRRLAGLRPLLALGFFVAFVLLTMRAVLKASWLGYAFRLDSPYLYCAALLGFDYADFGFVRRGLAGSVLGLFSRDLLLNAVVLHLVSAAALSAAIVRFLVPLRRPLMLKAAFVAAVAALLLRWGEDPGRTDMVVAALVGLAAALFLAQRFVLAMAALAVGLAVHETAYIFGLPLLAALALDHGALRALPRRAWAGVLGVLLATLAAYLLLEHLPRADTQTMVDTVRGRLPPDERVDRAIYSAVSGVRGVREAICQHSVDPAYAIHVASGLLLIAGFAFVLRTRAGPSWPALLLASVPSFLFASAVAHDIARWAVLATFNVWLLCAAAPGGGPGDNRERAPLVKLVLALLFVPLMHPSVGRIDSPLFAPLPVFERLIAEAGGPRAPRFAPMLEQCDPNWREVLGEAPRAALSRR